MSDLALVIARAVHIGAAMLLFGELLFAVALTSVGVGPDGDGAPAPGARRRIAWALACSAVSWAAWLAIVAARMAGASLRQALDADTMMLVLRASEFGHWWSLRVVVLVILAIVCLSRNRRPTNDASQGRSTRFALGLAAAYLATLAFAGHATAASEGGLRVMHLACDALHALAAGAWLGALPMLVALLRSDRSGAIVARAVPVFSVLGIASVAILFASGLVNAWLLVGSPARMWDTPYGQLLALKLAVFALLLSLAAANRWLLSPRVSGDDVVARASLRRNAALEICGGIVIVVIVGVLGTMVPAAHQAPMAMHHMG